MRIIAGQRRGHKIGGPRPKADMRLTSDLVRDSIFNEYEIHRRQLGQLLRSFVEKLPADSVIALEAGRDLDGEILPDFESWDIRRYGETQIAIRVLSGTAPGPVSEARLAIREEPAADREEEADV